MNPIFTLFCILCHISNVYSSGIIRQNLTSSSQVILRFTPIQTTNGLQIFRKPIYIPLYANRTKQFDFSIEKYNETFSFEVQIINSENKKAIGGKFDRTISVKNDEEWINDSFSIHGVSLRIQTIFVCSENYYGPNCEYYCNQKEISRKGRKRCDKLGKIRCDFGWMGPHCSKAVDPRKCGCHNEGVCVSSAVYNTNISTPNEQLVCECQAGFIGAKCEIAIVPGKIATKFGACDSDDICLNGAQCFSNGPTPFCVCSSAYTGLLCETPISSDLPIIRTPSNYSMCLYIITAIAILLIITAACVTYKFKPNRSDAMTRFQTIHSFAQRNNCVPGALLICKPEVESKDSKIFSIDASHLQQSVENGNTEKYERYTAAPNNYSAIIRMENDYAVINKPAPPTKMPPPIPMVP